MNTLGKKSLSTLVAAFVNILWWIEWVGCSAIFVVGLITAIIRKGFVLNIPVSFSTITLRHISALNKDFPAGTLNATNGTLFIDIHATWQNVAMLLLVFIIISGMIIIITYQLKAIFANLKRNLPFTELNIGRIRNIAFVLIIYSVCQWIAVAVINQILVSNLDWGPVQLTYGFNISCLFTGIILIIVAEIFKQGVLLEEEKSLTI